MIKYTAFLFSFVYGLILGLVWFLLPFGLAVRPSGQGRPSLFFEIDHTAYITLPISVKKYFHFIWVKFYGKIGGFNYIIGEILIGLQSVLCVGVCESRVVNRKIGGRKPNCKLNRKLCQGHLCPSQNFLSSFLRFYLTKPMAVWYNLSGLWRNR